MPRIYKLSRTGLKLLYKVRHHKGHGIHSPFVFNLVTKVIEEKTAFHAYDDIRFIVNSKSEKHYRLNKYNLLFFRLVNHFNARKILEIGSGYGVNTLCLTAPHKDCMCTSVETSKPKYAQAQDLYNNWDRKIQLLTDKNLPVLSEKQDCIFIDLSNYNTFPDGFNNYLLNLSHTNTFIIVKGIRTSRQHQTLWKNIASLEGRTAVLDLFNVGILFFDTKLYKWDYQISF